jgi:hypothetical protein
MHRWHCLLGLQVFLILIFGHAQAFVVRPLSSLERQTIKTDIIIRARAIRVTPSTSPNEFELIRFQILEVLKGLPASEKEIVVSNRFWNTKRNTWKRGECDAVLFLNWDSGILQISHLVSMTEPEEIVFWCSDFRRLSEPDEILEVLREAIKVPGMANAGEFTAWDGRRHLIVPRNQVLLWSACNWANSSKPQLRQSGAQALALFDAPDIPARLRPLMADPYSKFEGEALWLQRIYPVRQAASSWYINRVLSPPPAVLVEPVFERIGTRKLLLSAVLILLCLGFSIATARAIRVFPRPHSSQSVHPAFILAVLVSVVSAIVWLRTWHMVDEFALTGNSTWEIAFMRGKFLCTRLDPIQPTGVFHACYSTVSGLEDRWEFANAGQPLFSWLPGIRTATGTFSPSTQGISHDYRVITVTLWPIVTLLAIPVGLPMVSHLQRRRRLRRGLCPYCGFDLRATADRCPECGNVAGK